MWTRAELKEKSKVILKQNYWKCVIVGLILGVVMNAGSTVQDGKPSRKLRMQAVQQRFLTRKCWGL